MCAFCNSRQFAKTPPGGLRERRICPINKLQVVFIAETYFTNRGHLGYHGVILLKPSDAMVNNISCIGLSHVRCEETACNSDDVLTTGPLGMNFRDILKRKNAKKKKKKKKETFRVAKCVLEHQLKYMRHVWIITPNRLFATVGVSPTRHQEGREKGASTPVVNYGWLYWLYFLDLFY